MKDVLQAHVILRAALEAAAQDLMDPVLTIFASRAKIAPQDDAEEL